MDKAVKAMKLYHEAQACGKPQVEVDRSKSIAEALFQSLADFNLQVIIGSAIHFQRN